MDSRRIVRGTEDSFRTGSFDFFVSGLETGLRVVEGEGGVMRLLGDLSCIFGFRGGVVTMGRLLDGFGSVDSIVVSDSVEDSGRGAKRVLSSDLAS